MIRLNILILIVMVIPAFAGANDNDHLRPIPMGPGGPNVTPQIDSRAESPTLPGLEGNPSKFIPLAKGITPENLSKGIQDLNLSRGEEFKREADDFANMIANTPNGLSLLGAGGAGGPSGGVVDPQALLRAFCLGQLNNDDLQELSDAFKRIGEPKGESKKGSDSETSTPRISATRGDSDSKRPGDGTSPPRPLSTFADAGSKDSSSNDEFSHPRKTATEGETKSESSPPRPSATGAGSGGGASPTGTSNPRIAATLSGDNDGEGSGKGDDVSKDGGKAGPGGPGGFDPNNLFNPDDCPQQTPRDPDGDGLGKEGKNPNNRQPGQRGPGNGGDPAGGGGGGLPQLGGGQAPPGGEKGGIDPVNIAPPGAFPGFKPPPAPEEKFIPPSNIPSYQFVGLGDEIQKMTAEFITRITATAANFFPNGIPQRVAPVAQKPTVNLRTLLNKTAPAPTTRSRR